MNWLYYLAEANVYLGVFYLAYCLFLNRNTHYQLSRAYLVLICIVSFILPVLQVGALRPVKPAEHVNAFAYVTPPPMKIMERPSYPIVNTAAEAGAGPVSAAPLSERYSTMQNGLWYAYLTGAGILLVMLFIKLYTLYRLAGKEQSVNQGKYSVIYLPGTDVAFSFFNRLFIGDNAPGANTIITHELVHIRQKHSADIIFLELLKVINWFNPFVYLLQNSLKTVHEYIADEHTAAHETDVLAYASFLLSNAYGAGGSSITHSFFNYNLLKKRIIMLNQQRSGNLARLKYLVAVPICAALLCASTLVFSKTYGWVDLAPARVSASTINVNHAIKRKRLKITQNGVTTITDQYAINQKNKNIVVTAATITEADKASLAKKEHIKVEVVTDSTQYTTKDGRPMLPVVNVDGYHLMDHFLHNNIHFTSVKGDKGGLVEVGFTLNQDRHITDAKIVKSGGARLDALALGGFTAYKGVVTDDPGKNYKIGVYFFTDDYSIFKTDSLQKDPEFAGELIITNYKYPTNVTPKGYEYDESGLSLPGATRSYAEVIIYDKNGAGSSYFQNKCTPADLKMLKDKYGYTFPSADAEAIQFIYPQNVKKSHLAFIFDVKSYLDEPYSGHFYSYILNNTVYPQQEQKALKGGVVILSFNIGSDGMMSDIKITKSAGRDFDDAAVNALQAYKEPIKDIAGRHSISILFCVAEKKYRPAVSEKISKDGYVGELAVSDIKSPFISSGGK